MTTEEEWALVRETFRVAGVSSVVLCVPPDKDGTVNAPTLAAAALAGVDEVYRIGGAQAIGAMAYGTETILPVRRTCIPSLISVSGPRMMTPTLSSSRFRAIP